MDRSALDRPTSYPNFAKGVPYRADSQFASPARGFPGVGSSYAWKPMPISPARSTPTPAPQQATAGGQTTSAPPSSASSASFSSVPASNPFAASLRSAPQPSFSSTEILSPRRSPRRRAVPESVARTKARPWTDNEININAGGGGFPRGSPHLSTRTSSPSYGAMSLHSVKPSQQHLQAADERLQRPPTTSDMSMADSLASEDARRRGRDEAALRQAEAERDEALQQRAEVERRVSRLEGEVVPQLEGQVSELKSQLEAAQKKKGELEATVLELQTSSSVRVLEGKVAGLQAMLEEKSREHEQALAARTTMQMRIDELANSHEQASQTIEGLEKEAGQNAIILAELRRELAKEHRKLNAMEHDLEVQMERAHAAEREKQAMEAEKDRLETEWKSEARLKSRQLQDGEMEKLSMADHLASLQGEVDELRRQLRASEVERKGAEERAREKERELEAAESAVSRLQVTGDGLRKEVDREADKCRTMLADLRAAEQQRAEIEDRLRGAEHDLSRLGGLEEQVRYLEESLRRAEEDTQHEAQAHNDTRARLRDMEERANEAVTLQHSLMAAEAELAAKTETIERLHASYDDHTKEIAAARDEVEQERERVRTLRAELDSELENKDMLCERMMALEAECQRASQLEGKLRAFEEMLESRTDELERAHAETARAASSVRELQHRLSEIDDLERKVEHEVGLKEQAQHRVEMLTNQLSTMEGELYHAQSRTSHLQSALDDNREETARLHDDIAELKQVATQKAILETRYQQLEAELFAKDDELSREKSTSTSYATKLGSLESEYRGAAARVDELEEALAGQIRAVEEMQVASGRHSIVLQERDKEIARLEKELESAEQEAGVAKDKARALQDELVDLRNQVSVFEERESRRSELVDQQRQEIDTLNTRLASKASQLQSEMERVSSLEAKIMAVEADGVRTKTLEGKVAALEEVNQTKGNELDAAHQQIAELRLKVKTMEADAENAVGLEARIRDLRGQLAKQLEAMEQLEADESRKSAALAEARKELEREVEKGRLREEALADERARSDAIQERIQRLETAASARNSLEGKIVGLELLAESKEAELKNVIDENNALKQRIKDLDTQLSQRARVEDVIAEAQAQLSLKNETISRLQSEEARRRGIVESQQRELAQLSERVRTLDHELAAQANHRLEAEARVQEMRREGEVKAKQHEAELRDRSIQQERQSVELRDLRERLTAAEKDSRVSSQRLSEATSEVTRLRAQLQKVGSEGGATAVELSECRRLLSADREQITKLTLEVNAAQQRVSELESQLESRSSVAAATEERLTSELRMYTEEMEKMGSQLRELRGEAKAKDRQLQAALEDGATTSSGRTRAEQRVRTLEKEISTLERKLREATQALEEQRRSHRALNTAQDEAQRILDDREQMVAKLNSNVVMLERKLQDEQNQRAQAEKERAQLRDEVTALRANERDGERARLVHERELSQRIIALTSEKDAVEREVHNLQHELAERDRRYQDASHRASMADSSMSRIEDLVRDNSVLHRENSQLREKAEYLTREWEKTKESVLRLQQQLQKSSMFRP